jgi:hypothetical protein
LNCITFLARFSVYRSLQNKPIWHTDKNNFHPALYGAECCFIIIQAFVYFTRYIYVIHLSSKEKRMSFVCVTISRTCAHVWDTEEAKSDRWGTQTKAYTSIPVLHTTPWRSTVGVKVNVLAFSTSALDGIEFSISHTGRLYLQEKRF